MLKGLTWEELTRARIERYRAEQQQLEAELKRNQTLLENVTEHLEALETALRLEAQGAINGAKSERPDFMSMSVNKALMEIAREDGGLVVTKEAISILTKAGVFSTRGEANDTIHSTLRRSRHFRRERPGVYRLVPEEKQLALKEAKSVPQGSLTELVTRLEHEHPTWGHKELVKAVIDMGYDFQGKKPGLSVNMARQRRARAAKSPLR